MHFIKIGESYINLDNVTTIQKYSEGLILGYLFGLILSVIIKKFFL